MKKLLRMLTLFAFSTSPILQTNFAHIKTSKINNCLDQKKQIKTSQVKTIINESLNNNQEDEKKYLVKVFADTNLINKIQSELSRIVHEDNQGYFLYQSDVNNVTSLNLSNSNIASFKGLDFFPHLTSLNVEHNVQPINLADFQLVSRKIQIFDISENRINDIDIIMYFFSLKTLRASGLKMSKDFTWDSLFLPLSGIKTLTYLSLTSNSISDISLLSGLINLNFLYLISNRISDISSLSGLTNLIELDLRGNSISDISLLSGLINLTHLLLGFNSISDISSLSSLINLSSLYLDSNRISDISLLSGLINLIDLSLGGNSISDISLLSGLINLTHLYLDSNRISDISLLSGLINLTDLSLGGNSISDISSLSSLINLRSLYLDSNRISDISSLSSLINLSSLYLDSNRISDISLLSSLINLLSLKLDANYIPKNDAAWEALHQLPYYQYSWDNEVVRKSQK